MKLWLILLLFLLSGTTEAQNWEDDRTLLSHAKAPSAKASGLSIHLMPFSLLNNPSRLRLGAQYKHKRFGYLLDLEYGADKLRVLFDGNSDPEYVFWGFRPELRYQLKWSSDKVYLGLELPLTLKQESHSGNLLDREQNFLYVETATERRIRASAILKIGWQVIAFRRVFIDAYLGGGAAYRHYRFTNLENPGPPQEQTMEWGCCELKKHGGQVKAELALGLRLGYWIPNL